MLTSRAETPSSVADCDTLVVGLAMRPLLLATEKFAAVQHTVYVPPVVALPQEPLSVRAKLSAAIVVTAPVVGVGVGAAGSGVDVGAGGVGVGVAVAGGVVGEGVGVAAPGFRLVARKSSYVNVTGRLDVVELDARLRTPTDPGLVCRIGSASVCVNSHP